MATERPLLLDTHTLLWFLEADEQLPASTRRLLETASLPPLVSIASWWEIAIKVGLNKLQVLVPLPQMRGNATSAGCEDLVIRFSHILTVAQLPHHHRDPFDRLLIAQALTDDLTLVSRDPKFDLYGVRREW